MEFKEDVKTLERVCAIRALEDRIAAFRECNAQDTEIEKMICMQFMDYPSADYLKNNSEFMAVLTDLGGGADHY